MGNEKKKPTFKEEHGKTRVGLWLKDKFPSLLEKVLDAGGDLATGDFFGALKTILSNSSELSAEDKEHALRLIEFDIVREQEVTKRWSADAHSDSWLSKNVRPLTLIYLIACMTILMIADSVDNSFDVQAHWVELLSSLLLTTVGGYFVLREGGKFVAKKYK